jgi:predicted TIM-barrel fold metal-dependent hydrolase
MWPHRRLSGNRHRSETLVGPATRMTIGDGEVQLVSVNDHLVEPTRLFEDRLPTGLTDTVPVVVTDTEGRQMWAIGTQLFNVASTAVLTESAGQGHQAARVAAMWRAATEPGTRLAAMDVDGVTVHTIFPHCIGFAGERLRFLEDLGTWEACVHTYNDYVIEEYCSGAPDRLVPMGIVPLGDPLLAARCVEQLVERGVRGISFPTSPASIGLTSIYDLAWDRFFDALEAADIALFMHIASGAGQNFDREAPFEVPLTLANLDLLVAATELAFSPVLVRHPDLRVVLLEGGMGWMSYLTERIEYFWARQGGTRSGWPEEGIAGPGQRLTQQVLTGFIEDPAGIRQRHDIGVDRILWMSDFPHADSAWPHSAERLSRLLADVPPTEVAAMVEGNARRLLHLPRSSIT